MVLSIFVIIAGFIMILKTEKVGQVTGEIPFAEKVFGGGGTYTFIKVVGLLMIILSFMWMTGTMQTFLRTIFGPFLYIDGA